MDEDRLDGSREKLGRWSAREGSDAGEKAGLYLLEMDEMDGDRHPCSFDPSFELQREKLASDL
jgi:hypothetical protein